MKKILKEKVNQGKARRKKGQEKKHKVKMETKLCKEGEEGLKWGRGTEKIKKKNQDIACTDTNSLW